MKKGWVLKNWWFGIGAGEDSWESLGLQGDQTSPILKEIKSEYSLEGLMLKLKLQYSGHLMERGNSLVNRSHVCVCVCVCARMCVCTCWMNRKKCVWGGLWWRALGESEALKWTMREKINRKQNLHLAPYEVHQRNASPDSTSPHYPPLAGCLPGRE